MTWANAATEPSNAMVRGSPNRRAGGPLAVVDAREHERLEGGGVGEPGSALTEGGQEAGIGVSPDVSQCLPILGVEGLVEREVAGVIDRGLDTEGAAFFQIGLGLR